MLFWLFKLISVFVKLTFQLFVFVAFICIVLYLKKIILLNICILYCLVLLNSILFNPCFECLHFSPFQNFTPQDGGAYKVTAKNEIGEGNANITINLEA